MDMNHESSNRLTQAGRERGIQQLMSINLLKRLESSVYSFKLTLSRIKELIETTIHLIDTYEAGTVADLIDITDNDDFDLDDQNTDFFTAGKKIKIDLDDMDYKSWRNYLVKDYEILELMLDMIEDITPIHDKKLQTLLQTIKGKLENPINEGNKKIIVFTAFSDTAEYLYENVSKYAKQYFDLDTAMITGSIDRKSTIPKLKSDFNTVLTCFSPISKEKELLLPNNPYEIDILIATDCISEGQNLQDCDYLINYDIHWNPVRIIQRFGRIDRLGSCNNAVQLVNFWANMELDEYINLEARVTGKMVLMDISATGEENLTCVDEKKSMNDLEYRKKQLKQLQEEVVDLEEIAGGISITDMTLNDFKMDLMEYMKENRTKLEKAPMGMYAVSTVDDEKLKEQIRPGVIFALKQVNEFARPEENNSLYPHYMVYVYDDGTVKYNYLHTKKILDFYKKLSAGKDEVLKDVVAIFNSETDNGRDMSYYSKQLEDAINNIIGKAEEKGVASLFSKGGTTIQKNLFSGREDFELISFLIIK